MAQISKEKLQELINQNYSISQLANHFSVAKTTLRYWLKKYSLIVVRKKHGKLPDYLKQSKKCKCGETDPSKFYGNKRTVCGKCHNKYTLKLGKENKKYIVDKLGGCCQNCKFDKHISAFDVHHLDPSKKDPNFASHRGWSKERIDKEIEGCTLLCKNCHAGVHSGDIVLNGVECLV